MPDDSTPLAVVYAGWDGYQTSLMHAVQPLTGEQLAFRPAPNLRSVGEVAAHLAVGRVDWFARISAPGSLELARRAAALGSHSAIARDREQILSWLADSGQMIADTLAQWTVADLARTYRQEHRGRVYLVSYQWTIWRILTHDIHHGGELALLLGMQGIPIPELGDNFGHLAVPPFAE